MPEISGIDREKIAAVMRKSRIPGVSIAYQAKGEELETTTIGKTDKHHMTAECTIKKNTMFGAASLSKPIFAYLVLKLIDKGLLNRVGESFESGLDRPLHEILPLNDFIKIHGMSLSEEDSQIAQAITPRMLLSHSSGLGIDGKAKLEFQPGTQYAYSGFGLMYLQKVIENITTKPLEVLAQEEVFEPLKMNQSTFLLAKPSHMKATIGSQLKSKESPKKANAANSVHTTAKDYIAFSRSWMQDPSPIMQEAFKPQIMLTKDKQKLTLPGQPESSAEKVPGNDKEHLAWGLGFGLELNDDKKAIKAFHTGGMNQFRSQVALDLTTQSSVVFFANGRDHKEANGHVLGPLVIEPKIPIPHAYNWFYNKFPFAKNPEELIGGPNFGLRKPELKHEWQITLINQIVNTLNRNYIYPEKLAPLRQELVSYFEEHFHGPKYNKEEGDFNKEEFASAIDKLLKPYDTHLDFSLDKRGDIKRNADCIRNEGIFTWNLPPTDPRYYPEALKEAHSNDLSERNSAFYDRETGVKCDEYKPHEAIKERVELEKQSINIPDDIGYMGLYSVSDPSIFQVVAEQTLAAMQKMAGKKAIILDLRGNTGGSPEGVKQVLSFFLEDSSPISSARTKKDGQWQEEEKKYTHGLFHLDPSGNSAAPDLRNTPLYVLVDNNTFSAGEAIAYDLQQAGRATLIGQPTKGGAHPYKVEPLIEDNSNKGSLVFNHQFTIGVPNGTAVSPISGTNWEDGELKGVQPSSGCRVDGSEALNTAVTIAKQALLKAEIQEFKSACNSTEEIQQDRQASVTPFRITPKGPV